MYRLIGCVLVTIALTTGCVPPDGSLCVDGIDNDRDGFIDDGDSGCLLSQGQTEIGPPQCSDGIDNDNDGAIDYPDDISCANADDVSEIHEITECNDGLDNDGDLLVDYPADDGCENPADQSELQLPECSDNVDNDSNGLTDYPDDPGCESEIDDDESPLPVMPACSDFIDNDEDGEIDYPLDPGCEAAGDNDEFNEDIGECGPTIVLSDITGSREANGALDGPRFNELVSPACSGFGGEFVFTYTVAETRALVISTDHPETTLDTVVYLRSECRLSEYELGCNDDGGTTLQQASVLTVPSVEPGEYYVVVDSFSPGSQGDFRLTVSEHTPLHGSCDPGSQDACVGDMVCRELTPGAGFTCEFPSCSDGVDNDGDTVSDYPSEPGCTSPLDSDEINPTPLPVCSNGMDDDGDGATDYPDDPGCSAASSVIEIDECLPGKPIALLDLTDSVSQGTTTLDTSLISGSCGGGGSPEVVYAMPALGLNLISLTLSTDNLLTNYDTVLYVREETCATPATEVACQDDINPTNNTNTRSEITFVPDPQTNYFVFVDGAFDFGAYGVTVEGLIDANRTCNPEWPALACVPGYTCRETTPGAGNFACRVAACNDNQDNDGDGRTDFPFDPGCESSGDPTESPDPNTQCSDNADNDSDGDIDYPEDPGCDSAADTTEGECLQETDPLIDVSTQPNFAGSTTSASANVTAACLATTSGARDRVHRFRIPGDLQSLTVDTFGSNFDTVLYLLGEDCAASLACNDDDSGPQSRFIRTDLPAGTYYIVVDGANTNRFGNYSLRYSGVIKANELCNPAQITGGTLGLRCVAGTSCQADGTGNTRCL